ncbi:MAG: hypothetical protein KY412_02320, partial [Actinobacteria bacterium]|nr:hypothetical protein [Actinomycetota bacterium]
SGGSASMDALFGPPLCPDAGQVLSATAAVLGELVHEVMGRARAGDIRPREAAMAMSRSRVPPGKPYGRARRVAAAGATAGGARG